MNTTAEDFSPDQTFARPSCKKPWSVYEVAATIGAFAIFWPLGLVALFVKIKKGELWNGASKMQAPWANWQKHTDTMSNFKGNWHRPSGFTGNAAFDDYRKAALEKLEAERRKLDDERRAFDAFLTKLRHAKDREDFERFMADHNAPTQT